MKKLILLSMISFINFCYSTTIEFMSLEEKCFRSDLVALVNVTQAGGIYAEYEIIESYKGQESGKIILYDPPGTHGPWFPTVLYGQKYLIFASKNKELTEFISSSSSMGNPMALRKIKFDFRLPFYQGKTEINDLKTQQLLLNQAKDFLSHSIEEQKMHFTREFLIRAKTRLGKFSHNIRIFLLETEKEKIIAAYKRMTLDERWEIGLRNDSNELSILTKHRAFTKNFKPKYVDKLNLMSLSELYKLWPTLLKKNKANEKTHSFLKKAHFWTEFKFGPYVNFHEMSDLDLNNFQDNIFYLSNYYRDNYLSELKSRKLPLKPEILNKLFHQKIDNLGKHDKSEYTYTIVSLGMPTERENILEKIKNKEFKFHHDQKECLLAFLGDLDAQKRIKDKIHRHIDNGDIDEVSEEVNALSYFDRNYFLELSMYSIFKRKVVNFLLGEDPIRHEKKVLKILEGKPKDSIGYYFTGYRVEERAPELYKKYLPYLDIKHQIEEALDSNFLDATSLKKLIFSYKGLDRNTIFKSFVFLMDNNDKDAMSYYQKHKAILNDEYLPYFAQLYCSRLGKNIPKLERIYQSNEHPFSNFALRYLFIYDSKKYLKYMKDLLKSEDKKTRLQIAIILAEHGNMEAIDLLMKENLEVEMTLEDPQLRRQLYILDGRLKSLFSNMSQGKTNKFSIKQLKDFWKDNRKSYVDPWRSILNKNFDE